MSLDEGIDVGKPGTKALLAAASLALMCVGCMLESEQRQAAPDPDPAALGAQQASGNPNVPSGCSLVWSNRDMDSVLYCPDIAPPSGP